MIQKIFQSNFETGKNRQHQASVIINEWNLRKHLLEKESWRDFMDCPAIQALKLSDNEFLSLVSFSGITTDDLVFLKPKDALLIDLAKFRSKRIYPFLYALTTTTQMVKTEIRGKIKSII